MTRHYKRPVLLIEFEESKSFSLQVRIYLVLYTSGPTLNCVHCTCVSSQCQVTDHLSFGLTECISHSEWNFLPKCIFQVGVAHLTLPQCRLRWIRLPVWVPCNVRFCLSNSQLRILWCPSSYATAELFEELKVCSLVLHENIHTHWSLKWHDRVTSHQRLQLYTHV